MIFLIKYWKYIAVGLAVLSVLGALFYYGHTKYHQGYDEAMGVCETQKQKAINENISIREKQDSVIRADDVAYLNSLRDGTF